MLAGFLNDLYAIPNVFSLGKTLHSTMLDNICVEFYEWWKHFVHKNACSHRPSVKFYVRKVRRQSDSRTIRIPRATSPGTRVE